jgi:hypothetical protein
LLFGGATDVYLMLNGLLGFVYFALSIQAQHAVSQQEEAFRADHQHAARPETAFRLPSFEQGDRCDSVGV